MSEHPDHLPPRGERRLLLAMTIIGTLATLIGTCVGCVGLLVN